MMFFPKLQPNPDTNVEYMKENTELASDNDDEDNRIVMTTMTLAPTKIEKFLKTKQTK